MRAWIFALVAASSGFAALAAMAAPTPSPALLVLEKKDERLAIVDPASGAVVARVPAGPDPHEIVASDDGRLAYISNYGGPGSALHTLTVIDLVKQTPLAAIDLGPLRSPHGLAYAGGKLYFTAETAKAIGRYDPATGKVDWVLGTGLDRTHMIWVSGDGERIYTTSPGSGTVSLIQHTSTAGGDVSRPDGGWRITNVATGPGSEGFDISPDGKLLWAAAAAAGTISAVDPAAGKVIRTLTLPGLFANRLKFTLDGRAALISYIRSGEVIAVDVASGAVIKRLKLGGPAEGILMAPDGATAYVAHGPSSVAVIDLAGLTVKTEIPVGREPDGMAWAKR
jgi:YVTN family beta-propeller protein